MVPTMPLEPQWAKRPSWADEMTPEQVDLVKQASDQDAAINQMAEEKAKALAEKMKEEEKAGFPWWLLLVGAGGYALLS